MTGADAERRINTSRDKRQNWTLTLGDIGYVHRHIVDVGAAQHATADGKTITLAFALVRLHLHLDHGLTGRGVPRAHLAMVRRWKTSALRTPVRAAGALTARDVLSPLPGGGLFARLRYNDQSLS